MPIKQSTPTSLRKRYIKLTIIFGVLIIGLSLFMYLNVLKQQEKVSYELKIIDTQFKKINSLRNALIVLQHTIDNFLLDPTKSNPEYIIQKNIDNSINVLASLRETALTKHNHNLDTKQIQAEFAQFRRFVRELMEVRVDVQRQYPGMALSAFEMDPVQDKVYDSFGIMINEIEIGGFSPQSNDLYPLLLKTQTTWTALISQMRIYLANRLASFSNEILISQASSVDDISNVLMLNLKQLQDIYQTEEESFEGLSSIINVSDGLEEWLSIFKRVRAESESPQWRMDWNIMESSVIPLAISINESLKKLENILRAEEKLANDGLQRNTNHVFILLAATIIASGLFVLALIVSMNYMIFRPMLNIASALRLKAFGQDVPPFSSKQSEETQYLIDAFEEMDQQISQRQHALEHQSLHDSLTSLPNRFMLNDRLEYLVSSAKRNKTNFSLLIIDLDNFKDINDSLGYQTADKLLIEVADRLKLNTRDIDILSRLGGDEFAIILDETEKVKAATSAAIISKMVKTPYTINDKTVNIGVSIGISGFPEDADNAQLLLQHADIAMYHAKRNRMEYAFYDPENDEHNLSRLSLIQDLHEALKLDNLELYFQPQVDLSNKITIGAEALLRWKHPVHGFIRPDKIIEIAEQNGIINDLTYWVIENAMRQCRLWNDSGYSLQISINLSVQNLNDPLLIRKVKSHLELYQLEAGQVVLEITENGMMTNPGRSIEVLEELHSLGLKLSIDDFGTGFSSLSYLQRLPVDEVKIDKSFVMNMDVNKNDKTIVESVVNLGHNLGLSVVAEGVETNKVLHALKVLNCDNIQGFLISKPLSGEKFLKWLGSNEIIQSDIFLEH